MKKLSKDQQSRFDALCVDIGERNKELSLLISSINLRIVEMNAELCGVRDKVEETIDEFNDLAQEVSADIESFMDDKSDAWREGEKGEAYDEWKCAWEELLPEMINLYEMDELEAVEIDFADGNYPQEIG